MKPMQLADWHTVKGDFVLEIADRGPRRFDVSLISQGCTITVVEDNEATTLVFHGEGWERISFGIAGAAHVHVDAWKPNFLSSFLWPHAREGVDVGWRNAAPYTQLDLKDRNAVNPEVQAMMDAMQRNMLKREAALRAEFERKLGQAAVPQA